MNPKLLFKRKPLDKSGVTSQIKPNIAALKSMFGKHSPVVSIEDMNAAIAKRGAAGKLAARLHEESDLK